MDRLMERQLDERAAAMLQREVEASGITVLTQARTTRILGTSWAEGIALADGREIEADLVVVAAGVVPNVELARAAGLAVGRGIQIDDQLQTSAGVSTDITSMLPYVFTLIALVGLVGRSTPPAADGIPYQKQ